MRIGFHSGDNVLCIASRLLTFCRESTVLAVKELVPPVPIVVSVAFSLGLGAAGGTLLSRFPRCNLLFLVWLLALSVVCFLISGYLLRSRQLGQAVQRTTWWFILFGMTFTMCGWAWCCARLFPVDEFAWSLTNSPQPVFVQGVVVAGPKQVRSAKGILDFNRYKKSSEWCLRLDGVRNASQWESVSGYARIFIDGAIQPLPVGSRVRVYGRATRPSAPCNPCEFDYQRHSQLKRVLTMIRVRSWSSVIVCEDKYEISLASGIDWLHQRCRNRLHEIVPKKNQPLADSLLLGSRDALSQRTQDVFAETGSAHVLAISGLHVGLVAIAVFYFLRLFGCSFRVGWLIAGVVITIYAGLTGGAIPVVRATMLMWVACIGIWTRRRFVGLHALAMVAIALLLWNPVSVVSLGTLLSFLATAVLIALGAWSKNNISHEPIAGLIQEERGRIQRGLYRCFDRARWFVFLSASVWIVSAPLVIIGFQRFVPVAIGTNILIAPLLPCVMASGFACLVSVFLPAGLCASLGATTGFFLNVLEQTIEMIARVPGSSVRVHAVPIWWVMIWYSIVVLVLLHLCHQAKLVKKSHVVCNESFVRQPGGFVKIRKLQLLAVVLFGVGLIGIGLPWMPKLFHENKILVAAMGHGCGIVIKTTCGHCLVYDAGRLGASGAALRSLRAILISEGIHTIQSLVLSHADTDHFNAVPGLLKEFHVEKAIVSPHFLSSTSRSARKVCQLFIDQDVPVRTVLKGDLIPVGSSCIARVLHPACAVDTARISDNENSIVLEVSLDSKHVLFTGDIEGAALRALLRRNLPRCDVLIAPHHGSRTGLPQELASEVRPDVVIVSGSGGRDWPFVQREFQKGWKGVKAVLRTDSDSPTDCGAISIKVSDDKIDVKQFTPIGWQVVL